MSRAEQVVSSSGIPGQSGWTATRTAARKILLCPGQEPGQTISAPGQRPDAVHPLSYLGGQSVRGQTGSCPTLRPPSLRWYVPCQDPAPTLHRCRSTLPPTLPESGRVRTSPYPFRQGLGRVPAGSLLRKSRVGAGSTTRQAPGLPPAQTRRRPGNLLDDIQEVPTLRRVSAGLLPGLRRVPAGPRKGSADCADPWRLSRTRARAAAQVVNSSPPGGGPRARVREQARRSQGLKLRRLEPSR